ncbi:MAG TPA: glutamate formimidoyltransferase [Gemmatimonadaceae bacterium]|nr:glutamate formimidoyltransferase [Gemmatimonadaceae bacterium]
MGLIELVPNFSEGRRPEVIAAIRDAIASVSGAVVLDVSSDQSHNRTVITLVAPRERAVDAAFAGMKKAAELIDLTKHQGEHPRIGATDVMPFVPLEGSTMDDCVALARELGARVGKELEIPIYLYERAASRPERKNLADVRRGEFEGLRTELGTNPARTPDFGPDRIHPTAGATAIGARPFLVAYNVYLGGAENLKIAKEIAKAVRESSGGLKGVKGLGLEVDGQAQVSMNLVDTEQTPMHIAYDTVAREAESRGVQTTWSEIVGLVPERVLFEAAAHHVKLRGFSQQLVLENQVRAASTGESLDGFVASVASSEPVPGGGSVAAHVGALGAALAQMVANLTIGRKKYADVEKEMSDLKSRAAAACAKLSALVQRDADAYAKVSAAYKLPKDSADRPAAIEAALVAAAEVPLETARACADVAELAAVAAEDGNANALSDAGVAALLAEAGARAAAYNVRINAQSMTDRARAEKFIADAKAAVSRAHELSRTAADIVEKGLG